MRILYVRPKAGFYISFSAQPPISSLALASFTQSKGHTVRIFDRETEKNFMETVKEFAPDVVAVTLLSASLIPDAMQFSRELKAMGLPVLWGGHMASAIPELVLRSGFVDYVGISEGEYTMLELLDVAAGTRTPESVLGIAYLDENGAYQKTADRPFADLADFPPLDYSLINVERYIDKFHYANRVFMMITSKGCVFSCKFCFNSDFHRCQQRLYPFEVLFEQMRTLKEKFHIDGVSFTDELFGANKQALRDFCRGMKELDLKWGAGSTLGMLTREDLQLMHDSGCRTLMFGLESGSAEMRKSLHKYYNADKIDETFKNCREIGIMTCAAFIIGLPDETTEQLRETVHLYFRTNPELVLLYYYSPSPGSELYRELVDSGRLTPGTTLEAMERETMEYHELAYNFSHIPSKELRVIHGFINWQLVFGKKQKIPGQKQVPMPISALVNLFSYLFSVGLGGLVRAVWQSAAFFFSIAWYAHAYPSIRKKYDLYAKNKGRMDWSEKK